MRKRFKEDKMGLIDKAKKTVKDIVNKGKAIKGEEGVDSYFFNEKDYENESLAIQKFNEQKEKFLLIDFWTAFSDIDNLSFTHFNAEGERVSRKVEVKDFVKIDLPGPVPVNWVQVERIQDLSDKVEIVLRPSYDPTERPINKEVTAHFFDKETQNIMTFERQGPRLIAEVRGVSAVVNNQGEESGDNPIINTTIAIGGWVGVQQKQWNNFTRNLTDPGREKD